MSPQEFINDDYLAHPQSGFAAALSEQSAEPEGQVLNAPPRGTVFERANTLIGVAFAIGILACVGIAVYPLLSDISLPRDRHPLTLMLWIRGQDVTGEEYLNRTMQDERRKWDEMYRQSPAYLDLQDLDFQKGMFYEPPKVDWSAQGNKFNFTPSNGWQNSR